MSFVKTQIVDSILHVTLARSERRNALNPELIADLTAIFSKLASAKDVRAVLLTGEGPSFCAGADIEYMKSMAEASKEENKADSEKLFQMFSVIHSAPLPVIARVHGGVFGGGVGLTAVCDYVVADVQTRFCFSEVRIGIVAAVISPFVLQKMNFGFVQAMTMTALEFSATQAHAAGLVHQVQEPAQIDLAVHAVLSQVRRNSPMAMQVAKRLNQELSPFQPISYREKVCQTIAETRVSSEGQEGLSAFLQKRKPSWSGGA